MVSMHRSQPCHLCASPNPRFPSLLAIQDLSLEPLEQQILISYGIGLAVFCVGGAGCWVTAGNPLALLRRLQLLLRLLTVGAGVLAAILLHFEVFRSGGRHTVQWPSFGVLRPILQLLCLPFPALCLSHPVFRWTAAVCSCVWVILETMALGDLDVQLACKKDGSCESREGWDKAALALLVSRAHASIVVQVATLLMSCASLVWAGWCSSRFSPRMFSSNPPSTLPLVPKRAKTA